MNGRTRKKLTKYIESVDTLVDSMLDNRNSIDGEVLNMIPPIYKAKKEMVDDLQRRG